MYAQCLILIRSTLKKNNVFYGNNINKISNKRSSIHAEINALDRYLKNPIKHKKINIIVIRINNIGQLCNSKPCYHCIVEMYKKYSRIIKNIYYSDSNGKIQKTNIYDLYDNCNSCYISKYRSKLKLRSTK